MAFLRAVGQVPSAAALFEDPVRRLSLEFSFPEFIVDEWVRRFGEEETRALCTALNAQAPTVIRANTLKATRDRCAARLAEEGVKTQPTRYSPFGLVLHKRVSVTSLASFKEGWFEMQDEGSQLLSLLLEAEPGQIVVDACAGGGGKSLHLAMLMRNEGMIHAFDVDQARLDNMRPRLARSGVTIVHLHPAERDGDLVSVPAGTADAVLVDAPCSGVGTFRRNPGAKLRVSDAYVQQMHTTQRAVLDRFAGLVRRGGRLVYSTCTLLQKENEEIVEEFLSGHREFELLSAAEVLGRQGISLADADPFLLLLPHRTGTDGFFGAVMRRRA
jgi:16S rRNA (cytosine967-C5)-methyltransferase